MQDPSKWVRPESTPKPIVRLVRRSGLETRLRRSVLLRSRNDSMRAAGSRSTWKRAAKSAASSRKAVHAALSTLPTAEAQEQLRVGLKAYPSLVQLSALAIASGGAVLELGTNVGSSSSAFGLAVGPHGRVHTIEIDSWKCSIAEQVISSCGLGAMTTIIEGDFSSALNQLSEEIRSGGSRFTMAFIDGDHAGPIETYVETAQNLVKPGGLIVLDDVYHSKFPKLGRWWKEKHADPTAETYDLIRMGLIINN